MFNLTDDQTRVLHAIAAYKRPPTARQIADYLERPWWRAKRWHRTKAYRVLRGLERLALVGSLPAKGSRGRTRVVWTLTADGQRVENTLT